MDFVAPSPHLIGLPGHVLRTGVMSFLYCFSSSSDSALYQVSARSSFDFSPLLEIPGAQESVESPDSLDRFLHDSPTCAHLTCPVTVRHSQEGTIPSRTPTAKYVVVENSVSLLHPLFLPPDKNRLASILHSAVGALKTQRLFDRYF